MVGSRGSRDPFAHVRAWLAFLIVKDAEFLNQYEISTYIFYSVDDQWTAQPVAAEQRNSGRNCQIDERRKGLWWSTARYSLHILFLFDCPGCFFSFLNAFKVFTWKLKNQKIFKLFFSAIQREMDSNGFGTANGAPVARGRQIQRDFGHRSKRRWDCPPEIRRQSSRNRTGFFFRLSFR